MKEIIYTSKAPSPIGPYSQAIKIGGFLYLSGQIAIDVESGELVMESVKQEAKQIMKNLEAVLEAGNSDFSKVIKTSIFLSDMSLFNDVNEIYGGYFTDHFPARETVAVAGLPKGVNVEISMIASSI
jgi:2-iminobutanoate/2-iminopropanoate deaminase